MTTPRMSGPNAEAKLNRGRDASLGSSGAARASSPAGERLRGGRLNGIVPARLAWRTGSTGRPGTRGAMMKATSPASNTASGSMSVGRRMRLPSTHVPLTDSRSVTVARSPPGLGWTRRWRRETPSSVRVRSQSASRPTTTPPEASGIAWPASKPAMTRSSRTVGADSLASGAPSAGSMRAPS